MTMKELLDLGCPVLPEGQYYNIYVSESEGSIYFSVYQTRKNIWDKRIFNTHDYPKYFNGIREDVRDMLLRLADEYTQHLARRERTLHWYAEAEKYKGDHK